MKITMVASGSYEEDYEGQILHLYVSLNEVENREDTIREICEELGSYRL